MACQIERIVRDAAKTSPAPVRAGPSTLTLIATYQCTAACRDCCFGCRPSERTRMSGEEIEDYISGVMEALPRVRAVVFTGGECFLLGRDLVEGVRQATRLGRGSRCVTNGYWATSRRAAEKRLGPLVSAGLSEINFSTGDEHQRFVPFERVATASVTAADMGLTTLVTVEASATNAFTVEHARKSSILSSYFARAGERPRLILLSSAWVDVSNATSGRGGDVVESPEFHGQGCDSLFDNLAIEPSGHILGCCGLTATQTRELVLGRWESPASLRAAYEAQYEDLVKLWLSLDGPARVLRVLEGGPARFYSHKCQACVELYRSPSAAGAFRARASALGPDIAFRFTIRQGLLGGNRRSHVQ